MVTAAPPPREGVRFVCAGVEFSESAGLRIAHRRFQVRRERMELACPVSLHQHADSCSHDFARIGVGAGFDLPLHVGFHQTGEVAAGVRGGRFAGHRLSLPPVE